jgi:amidase
MVRRQAGAAGRPDVAQPIDAFVSPFARERLGRYDWLVIPRHHIPRDQRQTIFDPAIAPVEEVEPGDIVCFETDDSAYARLAGGETLEDIGVENLNAVTGPVAIRGAAPGDVLRIDVLGIEIARTWAAWLPGFGPLGGRTLAVQMKRLEIKGDLVSLSADVRVPLEPMIGCIGLAPAAGQASTLKPAYSFGGNIDLRELSAGATLWLPVQVPGALLSVGDLHAAMGQGEPAHVSLEAAGSATLRIDVEKKRALPYPRMRVGSDTIFVGMDDRSRAAGGTHFAYQRAIDQVFDHLTIERHMDPLTAYAFISARVATRFGGPAGSLVLAIVPDLPAAS